MRRWYRSTIRPALLLSSISIISFSNLGFADETPATAASNYNPPWGSELNYTTNNLFSSPTGSMAWLEERDLPWWKNRVVNPIQDYSGDKLPTGAARLDTALDLELTMHRTLPGWMSQRSPSGISYDYTFTPGSSQQDAQTTRSGQNAYVNFGAHPFEPFSINIGAEFVGNYDQRYWFPINNELRMHNDDVYGQIVDGEIKYDDKKNIMIRGFEGVPQFGWLGQNDLFRVLPAMDDPEYYRRQEGELIPRGGETRIKTDYGTLDVLGGSEMIMRYGPSVYAKYDFPTFRNSENTIIYTNENIPYGLEDPNERKWNLTYNSSYPFDDRATGHFGIIYQPFRLNRAYQDVDSNGNLETLKTMQRDAFGGTARLEYKPTHILDTAGLGYIYQGPVAGDKQEVDVDGGKALVPEWTLSGAYIYRQPIRGPVPFTYEGTAANPGAVISTPRGPDDPFWVQWNNRKAHIGTMTLVYDPTPSTPFFKNQQNTLDDWNYNPDEDATWSGALQYRVTEYPTNTDRLYYWDADNNLVWDPATQNGALATKYPFSTATATLHWLHNDWKVALTASGGQAMAGDSSAYVPSTTNSNFVKPSTIFLDAGVRLTHGPWQTFFRYGQDEYGPYDFFDQLGLAYHHIYQAGLSYQFLKAFELGFRYVGTRLADDFSVGTPGTLVGTGAFNEYRGYLTYHFTLEHNFENHLAALGKPLPQTFPAASLAASDLQFTPDGSSAVRSTVLTPQTSAESGVLSYKIFIRNSQGDTVKEWDGSGTPTGNFGWDGIGADGQPLPAGTYRATLDVVDQYGNEVTSTPISIEIIGAQQAATPVKPYQVTTTAEGLRVTLSSLVLFDVDKSDLKESSKQALKQVTELLKAYPTNTLRIEGHTDSSGSKAHNQNLSVRRAQAVATELTNEGVASSRIKVVGYGERRPVASNDTEEGRQQEPSC